MLKLLRTNSMKKIFYIAITSIFIWSCGGGGGGDKPDPTPVNHEPTKPTLSSPANNSLCIDNVVNFQWNASTDSDGDAISYIIEVSKNNQFSTLEHNFTVSATTKSITLEKGVAYYWRVKAKDSKNATSDYSSTFQLYTEGEGVTNHLPFNPVLVKPDLNSIIQTASTTLEWSATDVDGDTLSYDVYFGTDASASTLVSENQSATTYNASLQASTNYYWKIVVKDNQGGQTIGQIWNFKTD